MKVLIIGGSDAGISAALRIREIAPHAEVIVMLRDEYPNYSICGLPMFISGEVEKAENLAHRKKKDIENEGIALYTSHEAIAIDPSAQVVKAKDLLNNKDIELGYDKLILGIGAESRVPTDMKGLTLPGVFTLRWMGDVFAVQDYLEKNLKTAVIIGGGYVGLELADGMTKRGLKTTLIESGPQVLRTCHASFGQRVMENLQNNGVTVQTETRIQEIVQNKDKSLTVKGDGDYEAVGDIVVVCVGAVPNTVLGESAGCEKGDLPIGAFKVNLKMETNIENIYAAGDCIETHHKLLQKPMYLALGTTSHKQGRIAGENAVGGNREFAGTIGTQVIKIFEDAVGRTGLRHDEAEQAGLNPYTVEFETFDHKKYIPGAHPIIIRVTADTETKKLLGAQIYGHHTGQIAKRIDTFAQAIHHGMTVEEFNDLDLSYTPPLSSPWDPTQMAGQAWLKETKTGFIPPPN